MRQRDRIIVGLGRVDLDLLGQRGFAREPQQRLLGRQLPVAAEA